MTHRTLQTLAGVPTCVWRHVMKITTLSLIDEAFYRGYVEGLVIRFIGSLLEIGLRMDSVAISDLVGKLPSKVAREIA